MPYEVYHYAHLNFPLRRDHRYPLPRYARLAQAVEDTGRFPPTQIIKAPRASDETLQLGHTQSYIDKIISGNLTKEELRQLNLPWSPLLVERARHIVGATVAAAHSAVDNQLSFVLGGGTHHAHRTYGSGFCIFNDVAIAARHLLNSRRVGSVAIIDCDVHQGDGTATILAADQQIFTFSIHGAANFPFEKATGDLDIPLPDSTEDAHYLRALRRGVTYIMRTFQPEFVLYIAGADPYFDDRIGRLALTKSGLAARDRHVAITCQRRNIPLAVLMGGGYARPVSLTVDLNVQTINTISEQFQKGHTHVDI